MQTTALFMLAASGENAVVFDLLAVLAVAALVAVLMQRMRLAVIPAYLITGAIVGPYAAGLVSSPDSLNAISDLAIILLLFGIGLHLHLPAFKRDAFTVVGCGLGSIALSILLGWPAAMLFGLSAPAALAVCLAFSLSSTAVVMRIIVERRELHHSNGRLAFAILVIQDMAVPLMLVAMPALAQWAGTAPEAAEERSWSGLLMQAVIGVGGVALLLVVGRLALPRLMHEAARSRSGEVMLIIAVAAAIGAAVATSALGFSYELGAFLAGFLLSATPFRHQLSGQIGPARDLFVAVFFTVVGMKLNPETLIEWWWLILLAGATMSAIKAVSIGAVSWALGASASVAVVVALSLAQAGEFSLVLLSAAREEGLLSDTATANAIAIVVVSLVITPGLAKLSRWLGARASWVASPPWLRTPRFLDVEEAEGPDETPPLRRVIIGGFGPVGRVVAEKLEAAGAECTIIELNPATVHTQGKLGRNIVYGDIANEEVLESAGIKDVDALILTVPDEDAVLRACQAARRLAPGVFIAARTNFLGRGMLATSLGADHVTVEELVTAEAMQKAVMDRVSGRVGRPLKSIVMGGNRE